MIDQIKIKPIEWHETLFGYVYSHSLIYEYEVHADGYVRYRKRSNVSFSGIETGSVDAGKKWCQDHHASEVLSLVEKIIEP